MVILIAGATGAVGRPLAQGLLEAGHAVHALTRAGIGEQRPLAAGVRPHVVDVFERDDVVRAMRASEPEVVINQLTALPGDLDMRKYRAAMQPTDRLRVVAGGHLLHAANAVRARRLIVQSQSFITAPDGPRVHDESARLYDDAPAQLRPSVAALATAERDTMAASELDPVVLRYGFLYGPGTFYARDGANVALIERGRLPIVADGAGVQSFVHVDDAASAASIAIAGGRSGIYNVTDDDPAAAHEWLPVAARLLDAKAPKRVPRFVARLAAGAHAVHFATTLRGNDNARFKQAFAWTPSRPSWRTGFEEEMPASTSSARPATRR